MIILIFLRIFLSNLSTAIKNGENLYYQMISFEDLHRISKRATPKKIMDYRHAIMSHKLYNDDELNEDWQDFNDRNQHVQIFDRSSKTQNRQ